MGRCRQPPAIGTAGGPPDFVSVHFYPKQGDLAGSLAALAIHEVGRPLVIEENFPLACTVEELREFSSMSPYLSRSSK